MNSRFKGVYVYKRKADMAGNQISPREVIKACTTRRLSCYLIAWSDAYYALSEIS